ncbi:MAG: hypothetical protein H0U13_13000 [Gemmatimonadaceae bacterium]|nr:hypothetical protein [Gemmatimonadaceae bacterium]
MPVRFTSPSLGGQHDSFYKKGEWQISASYRRLLADQWFVGTEIDEAAAPFGKPLYLDIHSLDLSLTYGFNRRTNVTLTLPFSSGTHSRFYADDNRHKVSSRGIGDINLIANLWLLEPNMHPDGNVALGFGIKPPVGNNRVEDDFFLADGTITKRVVDQSIQPGDGGWGFIAQAQLYQRVASRLNAYASGSYLISPKKKTDVPSPLPGVTLAVPDVYSVRAGGAYVVSTSRGMSVNVGARIDGIPLRDVVGGADDGFRRPGHTLYLDPGAAMRVGKQEFTISVPLRMSQNFSRSLIDRERNFKGGGDLADYLVFAGYSVRF